MQRKVTIRICVAALAVAIVALVAYRAIPRYSPNPKQPIRLGLSVWPGFGPFFIAEEKGFFNQQGLNVQLNVFQDDSQRDASLIANRIDAIGMTIDSLAVLRHRGIDVKAVYKFDNSSGADGIIARPEILSVSDLKSKRVGWALGTTSHFFLAVALSRVGLKTSDLKHVSLAADDAGTAFTSGQLDGAVTWEPWLTKASETKLGHKLLTTRELPVIEDVLFFRTSTLKARHNEIVRFLRACFQAVDYWNAHPSEGTSIVARKLGMTQPEVEKLLPEMHIVSYADNISFFGDGKSGSPAFSSYELATRIWIQEEVVKPNGENASEAIDPTFVREAR